MVSTKFYRSRKYVLLFSIFVTLSLVVLLRKLDLFSISVLPLNRIGSISSAGFSSTFPDYSETFGISTKFDSHVQEAMVKFSTEDDSRIIATEQAYGSAIDVAIIFRHGSNSYLLQDNLRIFIRSMLYYTTSAVRLHIVATEQDFIAAKDVITKVLAPDDFKKKVLKPVFISTEKLSVLANNSTEAATIKILQKYFTANSNSYYADPLFFFSLYLHNILPDLTRIILMDIDTKFLGDIEELYGYFERFQPHHVIGMSYEYSVVYRHCLEAYRKKNPDTLLGSPASKGGFPGYNSGVMLVDVERLKGSSVIASYLTPTLLEDRAKHYYFSGDLGDQDLYTLIAFDHPEIFYTIPCGWNRQLCEWWRNNGYASVFDEYFECNDKVRLYHGNCKSKIPDRESLL